MYQYILFDLDGTLTDPMEGITKSVQYALKHFGIDEPDLNQLKKFANTEKDFQRWVYLKMVFMKGFMSFS